MRYLGLDLGTKTLGLALSESGVIASPYKTIHYDDMNSLLDELEQIIVNLRIDQVILGYPKNMNNTIGTSAIRTNDFKFQLENRVKLNIILEDERMTSIQANNVMIEANLRRKDRKQKVDTLAAVLILQTYLDRKRKEG